MVKVREGVKRVRIRIKTKSEGVRCSFRKKSSCSLDGDSLTNQMKRCGCPIWGCLKAAMQVIGGNGGECTALHSPVCLKDGQRGWWVGRCGEQLTGPFIYFLRGCDPCGSGGVLREFRGCRRASLNPRLMAGIPLGWRMAGGVVAGVSDAWWRASGWRGFPGSVSPATTATKWVSLPTRENSCHSWFHLKAWVFMEGRGFLTTNGHEWGGDGR